MFISLFRSKLKFYYEVFVFHLPSFPLFSARGASTSFSYRAADVNPLVAEGRISRLATELHGITRNQNAQAEERLDLRIREGDDGAR